MGKGRVATGALARAGFLLLALLQVGCAEVAPPPGGPPDLFPPRVLAAYPESLAIGVDPGATLSLTFSEKVDRRSVREWLVINPYRPISWAKWSGPTVEFRLHGGLPADTTIQVTLGSGVRDRAGLPLTPTFSRLLTTGSLISPGVITGQIRASRMLPLPVGGASGRPDRLESPGRQPAVTKPSSGTPRPPAPVPKFARFVWLFRVAADTLPDPLRETPYWVAEADPEGNYRLEGLPLGTPFRLMTLYDADRSRSPAGLSDYWSFQPDVIELTADAPTREGLALYLVDPKSPGRLSGRLEPATESTGVDTTFFGVLAAVRHAGIDSLVMPWPPTSVARAARVERDGAWILAPLPPGRYRVAAWRDENGNGQRDGEELLGPWIEAVVAADSDVTDRQLARPAGR